MRGRRGFWDIEERLKELSAEPDGAGPPYRRDRNPRQDGLAEIQRLQSALTDRGPDVPLEDSDRTETEGEILIHATRFG
jgi:hypothetical protein